MSEAMIIGGIIGYALFGTIIGFTVVFLVHR
jgi:hypothetical protein